MLRNTLLGAVAFGVLAVAAGYVWVAFEFPFAILLPAVVGWFAVVSSQFGSRKAVMAALLGGVAFTAAFMIAIFFALTDGSPIALTAWTSATLAAAAAGAVTGGLLGGLRGSAVIAAFAGTGMLLATIVTGLLREIAPASVEVAGQTQNLYFAMVQGVVGVLVGAAIGAGVAWLKDHPAPSPASPGVTTHRPHTA